MSRDTPSTSETTSPKTESAEEEFVWPEFNPSPGYRSFVDRLRQTRLDRKISIEHLAERVGLGLRLAYEFESIAAPLPFCHMSVWCQVAGVPFDDFLEIYWADEREWDERQERKQSEQQAPGINSTEADVAEVPATELSRSPRNFGWLSSLRAAFARVNRFFRSRFFTAKKTPE